MVEEFTLDADLVVGQVVRVVTNRLIVLFGRLVSCSERGYPGQRGGAIGTGRTVEAARAEALRKGVVRHEVRRDVPGQVAAAAEAAFGLVQVDAEAATARRGAGPIGNIVGRRRGDELRTPRELIVVVVTRSAGQRQYLRDQIKIR